MSLRRYEAMKRAVADPARLRILKMLEGGDLCVCQIIAVLAPSLSNVTTDACCGPAGPSGGTALPCLPSSQCGYK